MKKKILNSYKEIILYGAFLLWLIITFVTAITHESWIDEIYAWQISKFSIPDIFYEMRYEGHFALWYLILAPFSHLGFPLKTLGIISWVFNSAAVFYFIKRAPFEYWAKIILIFTVPFLYTNPAISRCYVLMPLLIFILADVFAQIQKKKDVYKKCDAYIICAVLLALLANTHVYIEGFTGIVGLILFCRTVREWKELSKKQKRNRIIAFIIAIGGALIALLQILPSLGNSSVFVSGNNYSKGPLDFITGSGITSKYAIAFTLIVLIAIIIYLIKKSITATVIVIASNVFMIAVCMLVYGVGVPNRMIMWLYFVLFGLWIAVQNDKKVENNEYFKRIIPSVLILLISLVLINPYKNISDFKGIYSGESRFAYYVEDTVSSDTPIYSNPNPWCCVIMEFLPDYKFYNLKDGKKLVPRADRELPKKEKAEKYLLDIFDKNPNADTIYIMDCKNKNDNNSENIIEQFNLPFEYTTIYPKEAGHKDYFLQYYLLKVQRPENI